MRKFFEGDEVKIDFEKVNNLYFNDLPKADVKNPLSFAKRKKGKIIKSEIEKRKKFWIHCVEFNCEFDTMYWFTEDELLLI